MDLILLICWCVLGAIGIYDWVKGYRISPASYLCAVLVCIVHYLERVI